MVAMSVGAGFLAIIFFDHILILSTAIIGSYLVIRSIGEVAGEYPNEFLLYDLIKSGTIDSVPAVWYAYFAAMLVLGCIGTVFQYRSRKGEDDRKNPYKRLR